MSQAVLLGVPTPCFSTALAFYDGYRSSMLPANLIQVRIRQKFIKPVHAGCVRNPGFISLICKFSRGSYLWNTANFVSSYDTYSLQ